MKKLLVLVMLILSFSGLPQETTVFAESFDTSNSSKLSVENENSNRVDLNTASIEDLKRLVGIGNVLAQRIVDNRPYNTVDDLLNVSGIGRVTLERIREQGMAYVSIGEKLVDIFPDPVLREYVLQQLPMIQTEDEFVTQDDLDSIETLSNGYRGMWYHTGTKVSSLSGIKRLTQLSKLVLAGENIEDISDLAELTNMQMLNLKGNKISTITALENLQNLKEVNLGENKIVDIAPISQVLSLEIVYLHDNQIEDMSAVTTSRNLKEVYLERNNIAEVPSLQDMVTLEGLSLQENNIERIDKDLKLPEIVSDNFSKRLWLDFSGNKIANADFVFNFMNQAQQDRYFINIGLNQNRIPSAEGVVSQYTRHSVDMFDQRIEVTGYISKNNILEIEDIVTYDSELKDMRVEYFAFNDGVVDETRFPTKIRWENLDSNFIPNEVAYYITFREPNGNKEFYSATVIVKYSE